MVKHLSIQEAQAALPRLSREAGFRDGLVIEEEGQPRLAILPVEEYSRFKAWEQRERVRVRLLAESARRRARPDWGRAFEVMDELSQRAELSDEELERLIERAVVWARPGDASSLAA